MATRAAMPRPRLRPLTLAILAVSWTVARPALAEDADALIKQGVELRRAGRDQEALEQFRRANEIAPSPHALAQIALAEQALGRWPEAEADLTRALSVSQDPWVVKNRTTLEKSLADMGEHLGSLDVLGEPAGAEVVVQGRVAGKLPLAQPVRVTAGSVVFEVRGPDYLPVTRTVTVAAGQLTRESVTLLHVPRPAGGVVSQAVPEQPPALKPLPPHREPTAEGHPRTRTLAWIALAAGSVSAAVGVTGLIIREIDARNYNTNCPNPQAPLTMTEMAQCDDWKNGGKTASSVALATLIGAGALGVGSAVLFYVSADSKPTETSREALACAPNLSTFGLSCALRF
jgi:hypothetical protein